jgi:hypothetical protein
MERIIETPNTKKVLISEAVYEMILIEPEKYEQILVEEAIYEDKKLISPAVYEDGEIISEAIYEQGELLEEAIYEEVLLYTMKQFYNVEIISETIINQILNEETNEMEDVEEIVDREVLTLIKTEKHINDEEGTIYDIQYNNGSISQCKIYPVEISKILPKTKEELLEEKVAELEALIDSLTEATWEITEKLYPQV